MNKSHKKRHHPVTGIMFNQLLNFNRPHNYMSDLTVQDIQVTQPF